MKFESESHLEVEISVMDWPGDKICEALKDIKRQVEILNLGEQEKTDLINALNKLITTYNCPQ